ncbi:glutathione S-transferase [Salinimonas sp. HHU 13199]|uniref:Glutathione S-transferase n=1 Tax=Salinimonas profundi TaxID=2729140 RepID=A0ABR8LTX8_9ALTE|nr:MAPEG family protein [Salinimonas profundi]MBD3587424.1 glutathione S-transferase [Salinimonas profundi]
MGMPVTAFYASLLGLCYLYLSASVIHIRRQEQISLGTGDSVVLERLSRVHGNFNEYVPITLILLACLESFSAIQWILHVGANALLFGRILHAYGLQKHNGASWQRQIGMVLTFLSMLFLCCANLYMIHYTVV